MSEELNENMTQMRHQGRKEQQNKKSDGNENSS